MLWRVKTMIMHQDQSLLLCIMAAAHIWGVEPRDILSRSRKRAIVDARQFVMFALQHKFKWKSLEAARAVNCKDHATALHAKRVVEEQCSLDRSYLKKRWHFYSHLGKLRSRLDRPGCTIKTKEAI